MYRCRWLKRRDFETTRRELLENPRVRWVDQENQGIGGALNTAVQLCRGVFIGQLDSMTFFSEAVEIMLEEIQRTPIGVVYGSFQKETPDGESLRMAMIGPNTLRKN